MAKKPKPSQVPNDLRTRKIKPDLLSLSPDGKFKVLPLNLLEPRDFERLCLRIIEHEQDVLDYADLYGKSGYDQNGIDVFAYNQARDEHVVYQCKRYQKYITTDLEKAVKALEVGALAPDTAPQWLKDTKVVYLCVSVIVSDNRNLVDAVIKQHKLLKQQGIRFWILDTERLSKKLKTMPEIVEEFYGRDGVERFCPESIRTPYLRGTKARSLLEIRPPTIQAGKIPAPSELLTARNRVVPLEGREAEVADFYNWLSTDDFDVRLYTGAGGAGKTRLLIDLCLGLTDQKWIAGFSKREKPNVDPERWQELLEQNRPVLVVFDYANAQAEAISAFCQALNGVRGTKRDAVRMVMLSRGFGGWYENFLNNPACELLPRPQELWKKNIEVLTTDAKAMQSAFTRACEAYAIALNTQLPSSPTPLLLRNDLQERVLFTHIAALLSTTGAIPSASSTPEHLLEEVLRLERYHWTRGLGNTKWHNGIERLMTLVTLGWHIPNRETAMQLLNAEAAIGEKDFNLSSLNATEKNAVLEMLHETYPSQNHIAPIEPDLLAEHLIYKQLTHIHTGMVLQESAFGGNQNEPSPMNVDPSMALPHLIRVREWQDKTRKTLWTPMLNGRLNNTWQNPNAVINNAIFDQAMLKAQEVPEFLALEPEYQQHILKSMQAHLEQQHRQPFVISCIQTMLELEQFTTEFDKTLASVLEGINDIPLVKRAVRALPLYSVNLFDTTEVLKRLDINSEDPASKFRERGNYANSLARRGDHEQAFQETIEVVHGFRELAREKPDAFKPDLATSLNCLGARYSALGQREQALQATLEAEEIYRELARESPDAFKPDLAASLNNLGIRYSDLGQREQALQTILEAVEIRRELARERPSAFKPDLAGSLNNLGASYSALGQREQALQATLQAVEIYRELARESPDAFKPDLARSLNNLGIWYSDLGQREQALQVTLQAVEIRRELARERPSAFKPDLAQSLDNLGNRYSELGQREQALQATQQAVEIYRELVQEIPDALKPDFARSLNNLGARYSALGQREQALQVTLQAIEIYRELVQEIPSAFKPDLAQSLDNLGNRYSELGQREQALQVTLQAVEIYRELVREIPDALKPDFARSLNNLGARYSALGQREQALQVTLQAVEIRRELARKRPGAFKPDFAMSLNNLGAMYSALGQPEQALQITQQSLGIYRELSTEFGLAFAENYAMSLNSLSYHYREQKQVQDALEPAKLAVQVLLEPFLQIPAAYAHRMQYMTKDYMDICQALNLEPDMELLKPIDEALERLA